MYNHIHQRICLSYVCVLRKKRVIVATLATKWKEQSLLYVIKTITVKLKEYILTLVCKTTISYVK